MLGEHELGKALVVLAYLALLGVLAWRDHRP